QGRLPAGRRAATVGGMSHRHVVLPSRPCPTLVRAVVTGLLLPLASPSAGAAQERGLGQGFFASLMAGGRTTNGLNVNDGIELTGGASVGVLSPGSFLEVRYTGYRIDRSDGFHGVSVGLFALSPDSARGTAAYFGASLGSVGEQLFLGLHVGGL